MSIFVHTCKDCQDRHVGCHSTCERYINAKRTYEEEKIRINKIKGKEYVYIDHRNHMIGKAIKHKRGGSQ